MSSLNARDSLLAALVAVLWGINFLAIHASLEHYPPLFLVALRFALLAVPTLLWVPRPRVRWRWLIGYGAGFGIAQFVFLYLGLLAGMPVGLASLVLQASAPFTVLLATVFLRERPGRVQLVGIGLALTGLVVIAGYRGLTVSVLPVLLVLAGALGWALGNVCSRQAQPDSPLRLTLWMSTVPPLPVLAVSLLVEGPHRIGAALTGSLGAAAVPANLGLLYTVVVGTVVGSGIWVGLLRRHPSSAVAPFSMLVPVTGFTAAWLVLGEVPAPVELLGGLLVVGGVLLPTVLASTRRRLLRTRHDLASGRDIGEHPG